MACATSCTSGNTGSVTLLWNVLGGSTSLEYRSPTAAARWAYLHSRWHAQHVQRTCRCVAHTHDTSVVRNIPHDHACEHEYRAIHYNATTRPGMSPHTCAEARIQRGSVRCGGVVARCRVGQRGGWVGGWVGRPRTHSAHVNAHRVQGLGHCRLHQVGARLTEDDVRQATAVRTNHHRRRHKQAAGRWQTGLGRVKHH